MATRETAEKESSEARLARESGLLDSNDFFIEEYFVQLVAYERKKTERSQAPFLLLLLRLQDKFYVQETNTFVSDLAAALKAATRDTDVKGWYRYPYTVGVLFGDTDRAGAPGIQAKVAAAIRARLSPEAVEKIEMRFHSFPGDAGESDAGADLRFYPDLVARNAVRGRELAFKRALDVLGSLVGLVVFSPAFLVVAACIKLTSRGPVFFRQERVGQYGRRFVFLKFRSMHADNDPAAHRAYVASLISAGRDKKAAPTGGEGQVFKIRNDPRITPIGRFIRKTSLDELPQLFNVLRGEMSLVGPRPPIPYEVEKYELWHRRRVFEVKPGITGLWQVEGRSSTTFDEMVRLDLKYVQEWSIWMDIKIILKTPLAVLTTKGAY